LICPGIKFKAIKCQTLRSNGNLGEVWSHIGIETISVHAKVQGRISKPVETP
jgi:hypothetical protein